MIGTRVTRDRPRLGACFLDDQVGFLARLLLQRHRSFLGGDERRAQQALELAVAHEVSFQLLDLVGEVRALAPDVLEADDDLVEERVDRRAAIAADDRLWRLQMSDLDR